MKIGDKVAYDELLGVINGETTKVGKFYSIMENKDC